MKPVDWKIKTNFPAKFTSKYEDIEKLIQPMEHPSSKLQSVLPLHKIFYSKVSFNDKNNQDIFPTSHILMKLSKSKTASRDLVRHIFKDQNMENENEKKRARETDGGIQGPVSKKRCVIDGTDAATLKTELATEFDGSKLKQTDAIPMVKQANQKVPAKNDSSPAKSIFSSSFAQVFSMAHTIKLENPSHECGASQPFIESVSDSKPTQKLKAKRKQKPNLPRRLRKCIPLCYNILKKTDNRKLFSCLSYYTKFISPFERSFAKKNLNLLMELSTKELTEHISKMLQHYTPTHQVFLFLRSAIKKTFPIHLIWGTKHNRSVFLKNLERFLSCRRFDKVTVADFTRGMVVGDLPWLMGNDTSYNLLRFFQWMIEEYIFVVLSGSFYITENSNFKNRLFFYHKKMWAEIVAYGVALLLKQNRWAVPPIADDTKRPYFSVRFCPKVNGLRPIMRLRNADKMADMVPFEVIASVLKLVCSKVPQATGFATQHRAHIYNGWKQFVLSLAGIPGRKKLFFVKMDIHRCFDSIPVVKLIQIVESLLDRSGEVDLTSATKGKLNCKVKHCTHCILTTLKYFLNKVTLSVLSKKFVKLHGIPQGWELSNLLCDIFYGHMEQQHLINALGPIDNEPHLILRYVDDYLFVTTSRDKAIAFLKLMHSDDFKEYGFIVNTKKTCTNFASYCSQQLEDLQEQDTFPWFGYLFPACLNMGRKQLKQTGTHNFGGVSVDLSAYQSTKRIRDFISVQSPGTYNYFQQIRRNLTRRVTEICFDPQINGKMRIYRNLYELAMLGSIQMVAHQVHEGQPWLIGNPWHFRSNIKQVANAVLARIQRVFKSKHFLTRPLVRWLFYKAFKTKMKQHSNHKAALPVLQTGINQCVHQLCEVGEWDNVRPYLQRAVGMFPVHYRKVNCGS
uniref:Telomerase reverse transcriptase n=1 Tax=Ciona intestinalis TaxID=7719 RepID=F6QIF4_CIOIN